MVASGQKNLLEQRMKICTLLWDAGIKVCQGIVYIGSHSVTCLCGAD